MTHLMGDTTKFNDIQRKYQQVGKRRFGAISEANGGCARGNFFVQQKQNNTQSKNKK